MSKYLYTLDKYINIYLYLFLCIIRIYIKYSYILPHSYNSEIIIIKYKYAIITVELTQFRK